jgi:hypothetical protein
MRHFGHICKDWESDIYQTYRTFDANASAVTIDLSPLQWGLNEDMHRRHLLQNGPCVD